MKPTTPILFVLAFLVALSISGCTAGGQTSSSAQETEPPPPQPTGGTFAAVPLLGELTRTVVYDDIWERPQLSKRDRSLITIAALQALYRDSYEGISTARSRMVSRRRRSKR